MSEILLRARLTFDVDAQEVLETKVLAISAFIQVNNREFVVPILADFILRAIGWRLFADL